MRLLYIALLFLISSQPALFAQTVIKGKVTNDKDAAILAASVTIKGTKMGTPTDINGEFSLKVKKFPVSLVFSAVGYESQERLIQIKDSSKYITIRLSSRTASLDEVVVTGFASVKRKDITGSVTSVTIGIEKTHIIRGISLSDTTGNGTHNTNTPGRTKVLTAGELSDFKKWALWEGYTKDEFKQYSEHWGIAPVKRYCVQVQNENHKGIAGEKVYLIDENSKDTAWRAVTDNTGKAELWANFDLTAGSQDNYEIVCETETIPNPTTFENGINYVSLKTDCSHSNTADIAFVVDATGSMGDEIQYLKEELQDVVGGLSNKNKGIDLDLAAVFYRDHNDEYLTRHMDFGRDLSPLTQFIKQQSAGGGGDYPEAVDAALTTALDSLHWDGGARAKILFLILDAPPHDEDKDRVKALVIRAAAMGIRIVPIVCSGVDKSTEYLMRSIALATNGSYVFLTDDSGVGDTHIKPTTDNFKVELLNDLLHRVISEMIYMVPCTDSGVAEGPVNSNENIAKMLVYPNPTSGNVSIKSSEQIKELFVADFTGKILEKVNLFSKGQDCRLDLGRYPSGTYLIQYFTEAKRWGSQKVVLLK